MSKRQTRIMILLPDDMLAAVEDFRFAARIDSRTAAIRELIRASLERPDKAGIAVAAPRKWV